MIEAELKQNEQEELEKTLQELEQYSYGINDTINNTMKDIMEGRQ